MDRLGQIWRNIQGLDAKRRAVVIVFLIVIVATWASACIVLFSVLLG